MIQSFNEHLILMQREFDLYASDSEYNRLILSNYYNVNICFDVQYIIKKYAHPYFQHLNIVTDIIKNNDDYIITYINLYNKNIITKKYPWLLIVDEVLFFAIYGEF